MSQVLCARLYTRKALATIFKHFRHEGQLFQATVLIERPQNLRLASNFHPITYSQGHLALLRRANICMRIGEPQAQIDRCSIYLQIYFVDRQIGLTYAYSMRGDNSTASQWAPTQTPKFTYEMKESPAHD